MNKRATVHVGRFFLEESGMQHVELHVSVYDWNGTLATQRLVLARPGDLLDISMNESPQQSACLLMREVINKAMKGTDNDQTQR